MKRIMLTLAALTLSGTAAFSQSSTEFAIMHFNMDADSRDEIIMTPSSEPMMADLNEETTIAEVLEHFNMDEDMALEQAGRSGVTIIMSEPTYASEIFERLRAESREDE
jgi:hypothetical protein